MDQVQSIVEAVVDLFSIVPALTIAVVLVGDCVIDDVANFHVSH